MEQVERDLDGSLAIDVVPVLHTVALVVASDCCIFLVVWVASPHLVGCLGGEGRASLVEVWNALEGICCDLNGDLSDSDESSAAGDAQDEHYWADTLLQSSGVLDLAASQGD